MWTCASCGFEADDSYTSCPFCGEPAAPSAPDAAGSEPAGAVGGAAGSAAGLGAQVASGQQAGSAQGGSPVHRAAVPAWAQADEATPGAAPMGAAADAAPAPGASGVLADRTPGTVLVLVEGRTGEEIRIEGLSCVLGREGDYRPELFSDRVSRTHLQIDHIDGQWRATHLGMNPTVLVARTGRIDMAYGVEYPLCDGERIRIADQMFVVRVEEAVSRAEESASLDPLTTGDVAALGNRAAAGVGQPHPGESSVADVPVAAQDASASAPDEVEGWFIACRKCGTVFLVSNGEARLSQCPSCIDVMDRRDIARVAPSFGRRNMQAVIDAR